MNSIEEISYNCTGCAVCLTKCPTKCITLETSTLGFDYPKIESTRCTKCGICKHYCHIYNPTICNKPLNVYAGYAIKDEYKNSSSGAIFPLIAKYILENNGVIYAAKFDDDFRVIHTKCDKIEDITYFTGSKYIKSELNNVFNIIKNDLNNVKLVYFIGTPCQVASLKLFLNKDYSNLICSDLICHGVSSYKLLREEIDKIEQKYKTKILSFSFKNKNKHHALCFKSKNRNKQIYREISPLRSRFLYGFLNNITLRDSCYECKYASNNRQGDITLGDYWGGEKFYDILNRKNGISLIMINTIKGEDVFKKIKNNIHYTSSNIEHAQKRNSNLRYPSIKNKTRCLIDNNAEILDINKYLKPSFYILRALKEIITNKIFR